ncbi:MAG: hypothetical protein WC489_00225 [Patescibacteria group bacterium]
MDFNKITIYLLASFIIVIRRTVLLLFVPYKTMRRISLSSDLYQLIVILFLAFLYFLVSHLLRGDVIWGFLAYAMFLFLFFLTVLFFHLISSSFKVKADIKIFVYSFGYTLMPTLLWFATNLILFVILPPPRTMSILGKGFSIFFIAYSMSLLMWKFILIYFSLRFSYRLGLYRIIYAFLLYAVLFIPLSILLYHLKIFRIPFI